MNKEKLLIVVDMQNDFISGSLGNENAKKIVANVRKKIEGYDGMIVYTMDTHHDDYLQTEEGRKLPVVHCIENTEGWKLANDIPYTPKTDGKYLKEVYLKEKFGSRDLVDDVRYLEENNGLKEVELIGLCTDICVISNAMSLKAMLKDTIIMVDASCTAGCTPTAHQEAIHMMKACQIDITGE